MYFKWVNWRVCELYLYKTLPTPPETAKITTALGAALVVWLPGCVVGKPFPPGEGKISMHTHWPPLQVCGGSPLGRYVAHFQSCFLHTSEKGHWWWELHMPGSVLSGAQNWSRSVFISALQGRYHSYLHLNLKTLKEFGSIVQGHTTHKWQILDLNPCPSDSGIWAHVGLSYMWTCDIALQRGPVCVHGNLPFPWGLGSPEGLSIPKCSLRELETSFERSPIHSVYFWNKSFKMGGKGYFSSRQRL